MSGARIDEMCSKVALEIQHGGLRQPRIDRDEISRSLPTVAKMRGPGTINEALQSRET